MSPDCPHGVDSLGNLAGFNHFDRDLAHSERTAPRSLGRRLNLVQPIEVLICFRELPAPLTVLVPINDDSFHDRFP